MNFIIKLDAIFSILKRSDRSRTICEACVRISEDIALLENNLVSNGRRLTGCFQNLNET